MPVTVNLVQLKRKKRKNGDVPIYLRITENRKSRYLSSGIAVKESEWNKKKQKVRTTHKLAPKYNDELAKLKYKAETTKSDLRQDEKLDAKSLKKELATKKNVSIKEFGEQYKDYLKGQDRYWEHRHFKVILNDMERFGGDDTVVTSIDLPFIERFQDYLIHTRENNNNTARKKMQRFKGMVDYAFQQGYINDDPFRFYETLKREKVSKTKLNPSQIQTIEDLDLTKGSNLWHTRNYFLFSFYLAGIRFSDLCTLTTDNLVDGRLRYSMMKTGNEKNIKIYPQAQKILDHYNTEEQGLIFPILDKVYEDDFELRKKISSKNVLTNKWLKKITKKAGIKEKVTFHVSRHSFAHYALKKGMNIYSISKALAHSDLKTTEIYLKSFDEELLDKEMDNLFN